MIILNELEYAEECIKQNYIGDKPYQILLILAKYYIHYLGYDSESTINALTDFMEQNYPNYFPAKIFWDGRIEKIVKSATKMTLYEIEGIWITVAELQTIAGINNKVLERLAFTMLCLAKLAYEKNPQSNGWVNNSAKEIFTLARISGSVVDRYARISELYERGLIELPKRNDRLSYRVTFMDGDSENKLFIYDFRELGYEYLKYCGQNIIRCSECGILTRGNKAGTKRYCLSCAAYAPVQTKKMTCVDCGSEFETDARVSNKVRCDACQEEKIRSDTRLRVQKIRSRKSM